MKKIVQPCVCEVYGCGSVRKADAYAKISFKEGNLSITGVVGPLRSGNCRGSCGQCVDEIRKGTPSEG